MTLALLAALGTAGGGCNFRSFTAESTADLFHAGSVQFNTLADLEFAEQAAPANLATLEAVWRVIPSNNDVLIELVQGWSAYGYAFMEDRMEHAHDAGEGDAEDSFRLRAQEAYRRAQSFGFIMMNARQEAPGGVAAQMRGGVEAWRRYLQRFTSREDVPALYWTGNAWGSRVAISLDDPNALLDLPFCVALMERARALDPTYYHGGVHAFFGTYLAGTPEALGGHPREARASFESALAASHRQYLLWHVLFARTYAVQVQDRALFRSLLEEVLAAGDDLPDERLSNQVARRRARRYLNQIDDLIAPQGADEGSPAATPGTPSAPASGATPAAATEHAP